MNKNKKPAKILLGILLMITFSREGFRGYKETGNLWLFVTMTIIALICCALLIRSAFRPQKVSVVENKYDLYGRGFLKIFSIMGLLGVFFEIAGIIPSAPLKKTWTEELKKSVKEGIVAEALAQHQDSILDIDAFSNCAVAKLTAYPPERMHSPEFLKSAEFKAIVAGCKQSSRKWTDSFKKSFKKGLVDKMIAGHQDSILNVDAFGNCMVEKLAMYSPDSVYSIRFCNSAEFQAILVGCNQSCKK
ncbi:MAG: hypothetical protein JWP12_1319 [Bacteroidetes bacterium]|nr:hypothetical protein [Bacteroidota bacterium]